MALIAGAGNPLGGSAPSSTGNSLNYIGEHVYALSGTFEAKTSSQVTLQFTTGSNSYIIGEFQMLGANNYASPINGSISICRIKYNEEIVAMLKVDTENEDMPSITVWKTLLPPNTKVKCEVLSSEDTVTELFQNNFIGRVYF